MKIAVIEKYPSRVNYSEYFDFDFDHLYLTDFPKEKILKKDITLDLDINDYNYIVLVGAETCKHIGKISSVTKYQGHLIEDKFIPLINPAMLEIRPEGIKDFKKAVDNIISCINGKTLVSDKYTSIPISTKEKAIEYINKAIADPSEYIVVDTETSALYPRDGYVLGIVLAYKLYEGAYIDSNIIDDEVCELLQKLFNCKIVIFHNAKFDIKMLVYHFNFKFPRIEDTMLQHYDLHEETGTHDLKSLALKFTSAGDYEKELVEFKDSYCKLHGLLKEQFTYDLVPFDIMYKYAGIDGAVTLELFYKFNPLIESNINLKKVYNELLIPGTRLLVQVEENGVPISKETLLEAEVQLEEQLRELKNKLQEFPEVKAYESTLGVEFNPSSTKQLSYLLFELVGVVPSGIMTPAKAHSTNVDALTIMAEQHPIPNLILEIRKLEKIRNTYVTKILAGLDRDDRLRTGFNLHTTTSGRLSSSGKMNMQQLPRDNKLIKKAIKAREGYKIISQDLSTAEMYVAAVLAEDKELQKVFISKEADFHSTIGKMAFKLTCDVKDVKKLFPEARQASKGLSFGILYGAGPDKVAKVAGCTTAEAAELIDWYFSKFKGLKKWLKDNQDFVRKNGYIYSIFGRKRRVPNVFSDSKKVKEHEVRSAINFLVQSVASDINLYAAIDMQEYINRSKIDAKIFALVHDSIIAEVKDENIEEYCNNLKLYTQMNRGCSIPGCPIGIDVDIGNDYSFTK